MTRKYLHVVPQKGAVHDEREDGITDGAYWTMKGMKWLFIVLGVLMVFFIVLQNCGPSLGGD